MASPANPTSSNFTGDGKGDTVCQDARTFSFTFGTAKSNVQPSGTPQQWVRDEYKRLHCNFLGTLVKPVHVEDFKRDLQQQRPDDAASIAEVTRVLDEEITRKVCQEFALDENGAFAEYAAVVVELSRMRPDLAERKVVAQVLASVEERNKAARRPPEHPPPTLQPPAFASSDQQSPSPQTGSQAEVTTDGIKSLGGDRLPSQASLPRAVTATATSASSREPPTTVLSNEQSSEVFAVAQQECDQLNWADHIRPLNLAVVILALARKWPDIAREKLEEIAVQAERAKQQVMTKAKNSRPDPATVRRRSQKKASKAARSVQPQPGPAAKSSNRTVQAQPPPAPKSSSKALPVPSGSIPAASSSLLEDQQNLRIGPPSHISPPVSGDGVANADLLARKLNQMHTPTEDDQSSTCCSEGHDSGHEPLSRKPEAESETSAVQRPSKFLKLDPERMRMLFFDDSESEEGEIETAIWRHDTEIQQAPLIDEIVLTEQVRQLIPQYGLLGLRRDAEKYSKSPLYLNTNVPFSAFICGVQGSGKSHTASCLMENALIPSEDLGELQKPLSALVFSYGHFSGDGDGFSISEAAFLACPNPKMATGACVKKVNVLVSPSNFVRISKLYRRIPNVTVTMFKLKPWNLGIDVMLTLMNVSESEEAPLYMAQVTQILRQMAASGRPFNYGEFKHHVNQQRFDYKQINMLQMRLNLLESFLDLNNSCPEPQFRAGEITIMDMSCPFVDANTACILFRLGLQRYLQSNVPGKLIVLDEAHKYMLNVPGARSLNEKVLEVIRLQRHYGARVIISTQEPTLLTSLIALCSITVLHRFSSPEWFAAVQRHIPVQKEQRDTLLHKIENLETGNAIVYSSKAILGRDDDGRLLNGAGKLLEVKVRKRITSDGGQSILAV